MQMKYTSPQTGKGKGKMIRSNGTRVSSSIVGGGSASNHHRIYRKNLICRQIPGKRHPGKLIQRIVQPNPICDNSNDSGLEVDGISSSERYFQQQQQQQQVQQQRFSLQSTTTQQLQHQSAFSADPLRFNQQQLQQQQQQQQQQQLARTHKRLRVESVHYDSEDACSSETFLLMQQRVSAPVSPTQNSETSTTVSPPPPQAPSAQSPPQMPPQPSSKLGSMKRSQLYGGASSAQPPEGSVSRDGKVALQIVSQPEQQHRARYQTEGSRGAIKDRRGNGFPLVKLVGYSKPTNLQIYIGTDIGKVAPHMFYQACKVSSKNSTPCNETKVDGTVVIEVELRQENDMTATCDCVGILKERNVDVEHRFPNQPAPKSKKKSTRCRMVFRCEIENDTGGKEVLQICSQPIVCTQPPGVPEIVRRSLSGCVATGGEDLFLVGKNFAKDSRIVFKSVRKTHYNTIWEESVLPEQDNLHQNILICKVPAYLDPNIKDPVTCNLIVVSNGKSSEPHNFVYTPIGFSTQPTTSLAATSLVVESRLSPSTAGSSASSSGRPPKDGLFTSTEECLNTVTHTTVFRTNSCVAMDESSQPNETDIMPPPSRTISMDTQSSHMSDALTTSLAAVKAEILEDASQSSLMAGETLPHSTSSIGPYVQSPESNTVLSPPLKEMYQAAAQDNSNSLPPLMQMSLQQQQQQQQQQLGFLKQQVDLGPTNAVDILDMNIKNEIARRDSNPMETTTTFITQPQMMNHSPPQMMNHTQQPMQMIVDQGQTMLTQIPMTPGIDQFTVTTNSGTSIDIVGGNVLIREQIVPPMTLQDMSMPPNMVCPQMTTTQQTQMMQTPVMNQNRVILEMSQPSSIQLTPSPPSEQHQINIRHNTSPVAVKKMILNAAAEILSTPGQETQSTLNAMNFIAMNNEAMLESQVLQQQQQQQQQHNIFQQPSPIVTSNNQTSVDTLSSLQTSMQTEQNHSVVVTNHNILLTSQLNESLRENIVNSLSTNTTNSVTSSSQGGGGGSQQLLQQSKDLQQQQQPNTSVNAPTNAPQTSIPQDIATMSESDLISFINPNAFDQV